MKNILKINSAKKVLLFLPILILTVMYYATKKSTLQGNFRRTFIESDQIIADDTINLTEELHIDGIAIDKGNIWLNKRFNIIKINQETNKRISIPVKINNPYNPIVNFYVENDTVYYYQANTREICIFDVNNYKNLKSLSFNFPTGYCIKLKGNTFLFQEHIIGNGAIQLHYVNFATNLSRIDRTVFPINVGEGMRHSGHWFKSSNQFDYYFSDFYNDYVYKFSSDGRFVYKLKTIDHRDQKLEIIKEANRYYLSPKARILRLASCSNDLNLFLSSYVRDKDQSQKLYDNNLTVDVYNIPLKSYKYSFYLPNFNQSKASEFTMYNNRLYALHGNYILVYNLTNVFNHEK